MLVQTSLPPAIGEKKKGGQKWRSSLFSITPIEYNLNRMQTTGVKSLSPVHFEKLLHTPPENTARLNANHTPLSVILEYFSVETHEFGAATKCPPQLRKNWSA